jgi:hypothetical protein
MAWIKEYYYQFANIALHSPILVGAAFAVLGLVIGLIIYKDKDNLLTRLVLSAAVGIILFAAIYFIFLVRFRP